MGRAYLEAPSADAGRAVRPAAGPVEWHLVHRERLRGEDGRAHPFSRPIGDALLERFGNPASRPKSGPRRVDLIRDTGETIVNLRKTLCYVCGLLLILAAVFTLAVPPAGAFPPVERLVLENGLVVLYAEDRSLPIVTLRLVVDAGSWRDPKGREGLANLTAESLPNGTTNRSFAAVNDELDFTGASLGTDCDKDASTLTMRVLKKDLAAGLDLFTDVLLNPSFPEDEIRREKVNVMGAIRSDEDTPTDVAEKAFDGALYAGSPYAHPSEGTEASVAALTREDVAGFHRSFYRPGISILVVSGEVSPEELKAVVLPKFVSWPKGEIPDTVFKAAYAREGGTVAVNRPVPQASLVLGHQGVERRDPDYYALSVMNAILGGSGFGSRLVRSIRIDRGLAYAVDSFFYARKRAGSFQIDLQTKNESVAEAVELARKDMDRMRTEPVSPEELGVARNYLIGSFPQRYDTQQKLVIFLGQVESVGLGLDYPGKYAGLIGSVTAEDVQRVAKKYLHPEKLIVTVVGDVDKTGLKP